jgi:succinyl-diaminopimelate desuccinylase
MDDLEREATALLRRLVRAESENPPGHEAAVVAALEDYFAGHGIPTWRSEVLPERDNLYARVGAEAPTMLLNGHMDTVPVGADWTRDPFAAEVDDGRLYGRGACDMKAGLAACAIATARLAMRDGLAGGVLFAAVVDEERGALGARHAVDHDGITADGAIVAEPTSLRVAASTNGQLNFAVELYGVLAHSSDLSAGHSAIADAFELMRLLEHADRPYMVGTIAGGVAANVIPSRCELMVDRRVWPDETLAAVEAEFADALARATADAPRPGSYRVTLAVPPLSIAADHPLTRAIAETAADAPPYFHFRAATDGSWFSDAGIPTLNFGPGDPGLAHMADEHVSIAEVAQAIRVIETATERFLAEAARDR